MATTSTIVFQKSFNLNNFHLKKNEIPNHVKDHSLNYSSIQSPFVKTSIFNKPCQRKHYSMAKKVVSVQSSLSKNTEIDNEVTLLDYGAGNVRSIRNAINLLGYKIKDVENVDDIVNAKRLIFPGVGSFAPAINFLKKNGYDAALKHYIQTNKHFFGICLGLQLLFDASEEYGYVEGLQIIPGVISKFDEKKDIQIPHIGWNNLNIKKKENSILNSINDRHVYFVHSYRATENENNKEWILSKTNYGESFISSIQKENVFGVQFHPEKSGIVGIDIIRQFLLRSGINESEKSKEIGLLAQSNKNLKPASSLAKRVIACLDVRSNDNGDLVVTKGDQYDVREKTDNKDVRNLGKPVELAGRYFQEGADEITFLNITGFRDSPIEDMPMLEVLKKTSENVFVPLTVGGGIKDFVDKNGKCYSSLEVASEYFRSGADKISIGSDAVLAAEQFLKTGKKDGSTAIEQISYVYGNQAVVVSVDPKKVFVKSPTDVPFKTIKVEIPGPNGEEYAWYQCTVKGGREGRQIGAYELAKAVEELGAGEILLNCIDNDGQGNGFDTELVQLISDSVKIPVIASSGAGAELHFSQIFKKTKASAALAAGIFHRKEVSIHDVKMHLVEEGIEARIL